MNAEHKTSAGFSSKCAGPLNTSPYKKTLVLLPHTEILKADLESEPEAPTANSSTGKQTNPSIPAALFPASARQTRKSPDRSQRLPSSVAEEVDRSVPELDPGPRSGLAARPWGVLLSSKKGKALSLTFTTSASPPTRDTSGVTASWVTSHSRLESTEV